jgi:two-component system, NtrC family, sensor histidine kinase HydH
MVAAQVNNPASWGMWIGAGVAALLVAILAAFALSTALKRRLLHPGGVPVLPAPQRVREDDPSAFMTASMQAVIQKLREQEQELAQLHQREKERAQQSERLSEAVTRNMPAGLVLVNAAGLVASSNPAAEAALGVRAISFHRYSDVLGPDSPLAKMIRECLEQGATFRREQVEYTTPGRELRRLGVTISPISTKPGEVSGALCLLSDLTELAALQKQIRVKESLAALGELSAGIAHEFKNALATISGYAQMIRTEAANDDIRENSERILEQTRAITHVVTEFLKFARPLSLAEEVVSSAGLVERLASEVRESYPGVNVVLEGDFAQIPGDEGLLRQALLNLMRNAAEAASGQPFGARVTVHGSQEQSATGTTQRISIADNGPGIAQEELSKIFLPFYTTKAQGTGLGLAIVQKIIVQHGGSVEARTLAEGGAEFVVCLPGQSTAAATAVPVSA